MMEMLMVMLFVSSVQPVLMVSFLIFIVLLYSLFVYKVMGGYWFSYALMLVMLSGVLVVFAYMVSLIPNESFEIYNLVIFVVLLIFFLLLKISTFNINSSFVSLSLWGSMMSFFSIFLVVYLLAMMLMVVWVSDLGSGAVRVL